MTMLLKKLFTSIIALKGHGINFLIGNKVLAIVLSAGLVVSMSVVNHAVDPAHDWGLLGAEVYADSHDAVEKDIDIGPGSNEDLADGTAGERLADSGQKSIAEKIISDETSDPDDSAKLKGGVETDDADISVVKITVVFVDWDDTVLSTQGVKEGSAAKAPVAPVREGYTFTGWDMDFTNVTEEITVKAMYEINMYTIWFLDWEGAGFSMKDHEHGIEFVLHPGFERDGYRFIGWDTGTTILKGFARIIVTSDMTLTAVYEAYQFSVDFYDWDGTWLKGELLDYGSGAVAPPDPVREGYTFIGWDRDFKNVTISLIVTALYNKDVG